MNPAVAFPSFLGLTVLLLGVVLFSGLKGRLRLHLPAVALAMVSLGLTVYFAEKLGERYDLKAAGVITPIHLTLAKVTTVAYLLPVVTGILTLRNRSYKRLHFRVAVGVLALTVPTLVTGCVMVYLAPLVAA